MWITELQVVEIKLWLKISHPHDSAGSSPHRSCTPTVVASCVRRRAADASSPPARCGPRHCLGSGAVEPRRPAVWPVAPCVCTEDLRVLSWDVLKFLESLHS